MVILILSYKHGISLHVPPPMNVVNMHYHSLLDDNISFLVFQPFALVLQVTNTGSACASSCTVLQDGMYKYMDKVNLDFHKY